MLPQCSHAGLCPTCTRGRAVSKTGQSVTSSSAPAYLQVCFHVQRHCLLGQHIRLHRTHREHATTTVSGRPFSSWQAMSLFLSATCLCISAPPPKADITTTKQLCYTIAMVLPASEQVIETDRQYAYCACRCWTACAGWTAGPCSIWSLACRKVRNLSSRRLAAPLLK
jgi:hypothetical protein